MGLSITSIRTIHKIHNTHEDADSLRYTTRNNMMDPANGETDDVGTTTAAMMECGSSLAEHAWAVPSCSIAAAAAAAAVAPSPSPSSWSPSSSPPPAAIATPSSPSDDDGNGATAAAAAVGSSALAGGGGGRVVGAVVDAWSEIRELRARLAADVVCGGGGDDGRGRHHRFPAFVSPYELPRRGGGGRPLDGDDGIGGPGGGMSVPLVYCDQTASQRPVRSIEEYVRRISMPCHANTHTVSFCCARERERKRETRWREERGEAVSPRRYFVSHLFSSFRTSPSPPRPPPSDHFRPSPPPSPPLAAPVSSSLRNEKRTTHARVRPVQTIEHHLHRIAIDGVRVGIAADRRRIHRRARLGEGRVRRGVVRRERRHGRRRAARRHSRPAQPGGFGGRRGGGWGGRR